MRWSQCILTVHLDGDRPSLRIVNVVILGFTRDLLVTHLATPGKMNTQSRVMC